MYAPSWSGQPAVLHIPRLVIGEPAFLHVPNWFDKSQFYARTELVTCGTRTVIWLFTKITLGTALTDFLFSISGHKLVRLYQFHSDPTKI